MLEDSKLIYTKENRVIMRTSKGDLDVTNGFPYGKYQNILTNTEENPDPNYGKSSISLLSEKNSLEDLM